MGDNNEITVNFILSVITKSTNTTIFVLDAEFVKCLKSEIETVLSSAHSFENFNGVITGIYRNYK